MLFIHPLSTNSGRSHFSIPPVVVYNRRKKDADVHWCIAKSQHIRLVSLPIYIFLFFGIIFNIFGLCSSFPIIREECSPPRKHSSRDLYVRHAAAEHRYVYKCVSECVYRRHKSSVEERERDWSPFSIYMKRRVDPSISQKHSVVGSCLRYVWCWRSCCYIGAVIAAQSIIPRKQTAQPIWN